MLIQRMLGSEGEKMQPLQEGEDETVQANTNRETLQRQEENDEEEAVQAKQIMGQKQQVSPANESRIDSLKGGGQPLAAVTRNFFEPRFGRDFGHVRIHQDGNAAGVSHSINARAFTMGKGIFFDSGQYQTQSSEGKRLLGHELTHVVQQGGRGLGLQRKKKQVLENDPTTAPSMSCPAANSSPTGYSLDITFGINSNSTSAGGIAAVENFVNNWHASGGTEPVSVDGYASIDGGPSINWPLSCERAVSLAHELIRRSACRMAEKVP
jgi:outer membrane protein OmpA-like peptidoglycan-associated protein